jgi:hypothetical protein
MDKDGKILLVETNTQACAQLEEALNGLNMPNSVACFTDSDQASEYLNTHYNEVFMVLQNAASPGLQLPESRNMVYMHEKFNVPEVAYIFLVQSNKLKRTFVHCYYRMVQPEKLRNVFTEIINYWKDQVFNPAETRVNYRGN